MANSVRAELSERVKKKSFTKVAAIGTIALLGLVLGAHSLIQAKIVVSIIYFIAVLLGILYIVIEINYTKIPSIECDDESLVLTTWDNGVFAYRTDFKLQFFGDFIPAKSVSHDIALDDISDLAIGTQGFLTKALKSRELDMNFKKLSKSKHMVNYLKRCDILCVRLKDDTIYIMSVKKFDTDKLYEIVDKIEHCVSGLEFKTNIRQLRKKRETIEGI